MLKTTSFGTCTRSGRLDHGFRLMTPGRATRRFDRLLEPPSRRAEDRQTVHEDWGQGPIAKIVPTVVDLAHRSELVVVAEGIETRAVEHALADGCEYGQGYLSSAPQRCTYPGIHSALAPESGRPGSHRPSDRSRDLGPCSRCISSQLALCWGVCGSWNGVQP